MKKGNRVLALFLAAAMVLISIAWDFSDAQIVDAAETTESTSAITQTDDGVSIDFDNIDVAELDANGYTSTKFVDDAAVSGEVNRAVSEHWFSGDGDDTPYGSGKGGTIKAENVGIKTQDIESNDSRSFMYTPYTYEDFQVSAEIYYGAFSGIVFGEKNVYPTDDTTASSVAVFFNGGRIHIVGAIDNSTVKIMRGSSAAYNNGYSANGRSTIFNNGSGDAIGAGAGTVRTLNVKKTGNHLIVWISGGSGVMTVELADTYETGWIGIQGKCYDGDGGGFKSLNIEKVQVVEHQELEGVELSALDDLGHSVSVGATLKKNSVADAFFTGTTNGTLTTQNEGMKGLATGGSVSALNIPYVYENFRLEAEVYHGQLIGVATGSASSYPRQSGMISVFFNIWSSSVMLQMEGALQTSTITRTGGLAGAATNQFRPSLDGAKIDGAKENVHTIVLEVKNGVMTVWVEGYDGYVTASVADTYVTDKISLIARKPVDDGGGFKSYTITNLDAGDSAEFDNVNLTNLDAAGYTASDCADTTFADKTVSEVWFSGNGYTDTYVNTGLKPNDTDGSIDVLNLPMTYDNFRLESEIYYGQVVGVVVGKNGIKPTINGGSDTGAVSVYINGQYLAVTGSVNFDSISLTGGSQQTSGTYYRQYNVTGNSATWGEPRTIVVELQDNILTISLSDTGFVWRAKVTSNFVNQNIGLFARRYNTSGNPGGGLKSYTVEKLPSDPSVASTVDFGGYTDFDGVDATQLDAAGFMVGQYNTDGTGYVEGQTISDYMFSGTGTVSSSSKAALSSNIGLKAKTLDADGKMTVLTTPYAYDNFRVSTEVYWGANTGIVIGEENVYPTTEAKTAVRIYFNANQIQLAGAGFDYDTAETTGGANEWNPHNLDAYGVGIFKPASDFTVTKGTVYKLNVEYIDGMFTIWVDGVDGVLTVKATDTFFDVTNKKISLTSKGYDGDCGGLKSLMVEELNDIVIPYSAKEFATYRSADGHTAPTYKNYLFAGWFTGAPYDYTVAVPSSATTIEEETVYAKFVVRDILTVKAQVSAELTDDDLTNDSTGNIRFATTVDTLDYSEVGFRVSYDKTGNGDLTEKSHVNNKVYPTLNAIGGVTYQPTTFSKASTYFKACTVQNVGEDYYGLAFTVVPFWKTLDGTVVEGDIAVKTVNQGINSNFLKGKTALFVGDSIQNGDNISGEGAKPYAWHERLTRYGMITEEVANKGWALVNQATSGRLQIVTQLDDATKDSYDFVILEGGVNDVRIDQDTQNPDIKINWGTINEDPNATFSDDNIAGAMQDLIVKTQAKFPDATIVYIINHHFGANATNMKNYVAMVKAACRVHGISYVDLSDTETYPTLAPLTKQSAAYIPDNLHPNAAGYELSTPVIADHLRKMVTGELVDTVYVASTGTDSKGYGTQTEPYQTLNYAIEQVDDGGTVYVQDALTLGNGSTAEKFVLGVNGGDAADDSSKVNAKQVTIAGANETAKLDASGETFLFLNTSIILEDIQVAWASRVIAEGNTFIVKDTVEQTGSKEPMLIAGSNYHDLDKTDIRIYAGTYTKIIGGQQKNTVGETNVIVGGEVNNGIDTSSHDHTYVLLGGNYSEGGDCTVSGDTNVTVESGAKFNYVYGAGAKAQNVSDDIVCEVQGEANVTFAGEAYGVYGGACGRMTGSVDKVVTCGNTNVKIVDGANVAQVFGGSEYAAVTGGTNVQLLGGTVTRRVWGGCYNEKAPATYYANGTVTVAVSPQATINTWHGFAATSRFNVSTSTTETGIFIFNDYTNNDANINQISSAGEGDKAYDYLVKVGANGSAKVVEGKLVVTPNSGYTASVTGATDNGDGTYTLTDAEAVVTFSATN